MIDVDSILQYITDQGGTSSALEIENLISQIDREPIREIQAKRDHKMIKKQKTESRY